MRIDKNVFYIHLLLGTVLYSIAFIFGVNVDFSYLSLMAIIGLVISLDNHD